MRYALSRSYQVCLALVREDAFVDSAFTDDLGADSLAMVKLMLALEEEFDCEILDEDAVQLVTVQKAIDNIGECVVQE